MNKIARCPVCNAPLREDVDSCFTPSRECPYIHSSLPELCSLHDKIYFGTWRKMTATVYEIKRARNKIKRLLVKVMEYSRKERLESAMVNVEDALDSLEKADMEEDAFASIKYLDQALSYIHHGINSMLREKGDMTHKPSDYEKYYDIILPFKEDW